MLKIDYESYLALDEYEDSPEHRLLLNVLERALRDLSEAEHTIRVAVRQWFLKKERLIPHGIGFGDILDAEIITAKRERRIYEILRTNGTIACGRKRVNR